MVVLSTECYGAGGGGDGEELRAGVSGYAIAAELDEDAERHGSVWIA